MYIMEIVYPIVGTTAFGDRPLIGIIRTIVFWRALKFENRQLQLCRVQLIYSVSTRNHCLSNRMEKFPVYPTICRVYDTAALCVIVTSVDLMGGVY